MNFEDAKSISKRLNKPSLLIILTSLILKTNSNRLGICLFIFHILRLTHHTTIFLLPSLPLIPFPSLSLVNALHRNPPFTKVVGNFSADYLLDSSPSPAYSLTKVQNALPFPSQAPSPIFPLLLAFSSLWFFFLLSPNSVCMVTAALAFAPTAPCLPHRPLLGSSTAGPRAAAVGVSASGEEEEEEGVAAAAAVVVCISTVESHRPIHRVQVTSFFISTRESLISIIPILQNSFSDSSFS